LTEKVWKLGDNCIDQTNEYKYMGVYVTRTLESNYHVQTYIKDNMNNKINFSIRRAALDIFTFVFIMIFAARNCMLLNKSSFTLEDVSQAPQQCEIEGRRTEFHNASPNVGFWDFKGMHMEYALRKCLDGLTEKVWKLGDNCIDQTNEYKYMGVYVTRTLESNYHVQTYII
jgi:hypothetical protein